jgi:signal transduction histidine kinase
VETDKQFLRNIVNNLISNASKYSDEGKSINIHLEKQPKGYSISVKDEGIGIPIEDQSHLFGRFFRASNCGNVKGTGLGLHIVKRYVDMMGGEIDFESKPEKGTTFYIRIPQKYQHE